MKPGSTDGAGTAPDDRTGGRCGAGGCVARVGTAGAHRPAPASTVRWSLQFPGSCDIIGDDWFWYESDTVIAAGGFSTMTARLWQGDRLVSWSEQLLAVFERR